MCMISPLSAKPNNEMLNEELKAWKLSWLEIMEIDSLLYCSSCWGIIVLQLSSQAAIIQPAPLAKVSSLVYYQHKSFNCCSPAGPWSAEPYFL